MKIKAIKNDTSIKKRFFLLMIVPLLIGLMISLTNFAHADWKRKDDLLLRNPKIQGWTQVQTHYSPSIVRKAEAKSQEISRKIS